LAQIYFDTIGEAEKMEEIDRKAQDLTNPDPFSQFPQMMLSEHDTVQPAYRENCIKNLNAVLMMTTQLLKRHQDQFNRENEFSNEENFDSPNDNKSQKEPTTPEKQAETTSFRGKRTANRLSYCILAFFELKSAQSIGLAQVSNAVKAVFGDSNSGSLNTKMSRWKENGILQWDNPDLRGITAKGREKKKAFKHLILPEDVTNIDQILLQL
jgi:hypothetical protein